MATRQRLREIRERGLTVDAFEVERLKRIALAAEAAFGAATLLEAQEAIGAAAPGLVTSMSLSSPFDSPTGASPQTTATRTVTVPAGNPGDIRCDVVVSSTDPQSQINANPFQGCGDETILDLANGDSLTFRLAGAARTASITLYDSTTGALIDGPFVITTT